VRATFPGNDKGKGKFELNAEKKLKKKKFEGHVFHGSKKTRKKKRNAKGGLGQGEQ